jgi:hypothetical protein
MGPCVVEYDKIDITVAIHVLGVGCAITIRAKELLTVKLI